jgi:hypothetical protein
MTDRNTNDDELLDYSDAVADGEGGGSVLLPVGTYPYVVTKVMRGAYDGSARLPACKMVEVTVDVDGGADGTKTLTERFFLVRRLAWKIAELFRSVGLKEKGDDAFVPDWPAAEGARGMCRVKVETYTNREGEIRRSNRVDRFLDPDQAPAPAPAPQPQAPPAFTPGSF